MKPGARWVATIAAILCLCTGLVIGQAGQNANTGTISGVIRESGGAPLPGVRVTAVVDGSIGPQGLRGITLTDARGEYSVSNLGPDTYRIMAEMTGFENAAVNQVTLAAKQTVSLNFNLTKTAPVSSQGQRGGPRADGPRPGTLKELCSRAPVIVDARVQSLLPPYESGRSIYTDALLRVDKVLKGKEPSAQIAVTQAGGTVAGRTYSAPAPMFQTGERYILFLRPMAASELSRMQSHGEIPSYWNFAVGGSVLVRDDGRVHILAAGIPDTYEGMGINDFLREVGKELATPQ